MDENYRLSRINLIDFVQGHCPRFNNYMNLSFDSIEFTSGNISFFEMVALVTLVNQFKPKLLMEFGTFDGRTTLNLAINSIYPDQFGKVITVDLSPDKTIETKFPLADGVHDPNNELGFIGKKHKLFDNYNRVPIAEIKQLWMDTAQVSTSLYRDKVDFLFIDASHSYENCLNDSITGFEIVKHGGIIAWHDYNGWPGVTRAVNDCSESMNHMKFCWLHDTSIVVAQNFKRGNL